MEDPLSRLAISLATIEAISEEYSDLNVERQNMAEQIDVLGDISKRLSNVRSPP